MHSNFNRPMYVLVGEAATVTSPLIKLGLRITMYYTRFVWGPNWCKSFEWLSLLPQPEEDELVAAQQVQELIDEESDELDDITGSVE